MEKKLGSKRKNRQLIVSSLVYVLVCSYAQAQIRKAAEGGFGAMASNLDQQFSQIGSLIINTAYIAGIGFGISAIFKFKQHKDNPQQIPVGTPFALLAVSVLLVFLPGLYAPAAKSIYGTAKGVSATLSSPDSAGVSGLTLMPE